MNILIIGSSGREVAILKKLITSNKTNKVCYYGTHNNPQMSKYSQCLGYGKLLNDHIVSVAKDNNINLVVVGPENALSNGLVDMMNKNNINCIGPTESLARIETSKSFARELMVECGLEDHCPKFKKFNPGDNGYVEYLKDQTKFVIKADGLHGGKGVKVYDLSNDSSNDLSDHIAYCKTIHSNKEIVLIEERLFGQEFSLMSFSDGKTLKHMIPVKDFKRAYEGDKGPNTGSMGSITGQNGLLDFLTESDIKVCSNINEKIIRALQDKIGKPYKGIIYGSYMKTEPSKEIKIIEFNARFGDPECINVLHLLKNDLCEIFESIIDGTLEDIKLDFNSQPSVCKYLAPLGYPTKPIKHQKIYNVDIDSDNIYLASMSKKNGNYIELGSRTMCVLTTGQTMFDAHIAAENIISRIDGPLFHRSDIGYNLTYKDSGVDVEESDRVIKAIKKDVESTFSSNVVSKFGDFGGLIRFKDSTLISSTDGVGTKNILVLEVFGPQVGYEMLGQDLVNHCVNDILVKGGKPLFFLDYFAANRIDSSHVGYFVKGIAKGCRNHNCVLLGGETAEMPDIYQKGHSDLVGTIVGFVDDGFIIDGKKDIRDGDVMIGIPSSGPHTNGYTLIRKLLSGYKRCGKTVDPNILKKLCAIHKSYYKEVNHLFSKGIKINGLCHITGGGFPGNLPRIIPDHLTFDLKGFEFSQEFKFIQKIGQLTREEMLKTFNCGIGLVVIVSKESVNMIKEELSGLGVRTDIIGYVKSKM